jgi:hypothetical protein
MRNRVVRGLLALGTVLALLMAVPVSTATAGGGQTSYLGDRVCNMYVNSNGFGAYCSNSNGGTRRDENGKPLPPPTWRDLMNGPVFIPCRDFPVPNGIELGPAPDGKTWALRLTIVQYNLDAYDGGPNAHVERAIVPLSQAERDQCPKVDYMNRFWNEFHEGYPDPVLVISPTYIPRVNVPAYFALTPETGYIVKNSPIDNQSIYYGNNHNLIMQGLVTVMTVDPGDGTKPFTCLMGVTKIDENGYDEKSDPFHQMNTCKHVYKRSSANQPDGMYTVKLTLRWEVSYWKGADGWKFVDAAEVHAVQRLPVQEVQAIGG